MSEKVKIVVAEDEDDIRDLIHFNLFKEDFDVKLACDGVEALDLIKKEKPDLALLDIMMPNKDGLSVTEDIRADQQLDSMGIIMLTAKGTEEDIVKGLELGADDYITKPFKPKELVARIKALLRRKKTAPQASSDKITFHQIELYPTKRKVFSNGNELDLTYTEFQLLLLLGKNPGWVYTRSQIVDEIRGENHAITDRSVDVQVVGLRKKLGSLGELIETVRGVGYRLKEEGA